QVVYEGESKGCVSFMLHTPIDRNPWRELNDLARQKNWKIRELADKPLSLEETFLTLTEKATEQLKTK
ncbi:MAG: ABC transporter ATP-binding protein, partial [Candidatus Hydrogenedentes bacterium]|nr:ABC transporter ATP-binding protein [Candidatus Hydrogenedentota bacterium]